VTLIILSAIDLRYRLLPNKLVGFFAITGILFHYAAGWEVISPVSMLFGAFLGGGLLLVIRFVAYLYYVDDALGLGDVKFMAAAGLWLGIPDIFIALTLGSLFSLVHGCALCYMIYREKKSWPDLDRVSIPAGLGFSIGTALTGAWILG